MHVVFTVGTYYPLWSATSRCAKNLVDVMTPHHEVTVIAERRWDSPDDTRDLDLAENLRYVCTGVGAVRAAVDRRMNVDGSSGIWYVLDRVLAGLRYGQLVFSRTACRTSEVNAYLGELEGLDPAPDWLIPVSLPFSGVVACALYKKAHPEVMLTPVIFDQFSESATLLKTAVEKRLKWKANVELEQMVAEASDRLFAVTWDEHVAKYLPEYVDKFQHIEHPMLFRNELVDRSADTLFGAGLHAVYAGAINVGVRDPRHLTNVFEGYAEREGERLMLHAFVMGDGAAAVREAEARHPDDIELCKVVPHDELMSAYASASVLVSLGNNVVDQKASKITEYMGTGKPIVHIACRDDDPAIPDMERYPLGLVLRTEDATEVNQDRLAEFVSRTKGQRVSFEDVARIFPEEVPAYVCDAIFESARVREGGSANGRNR